MLKFTMSSEEINSNAGFSFVKSLLDSNSCMPLWDSRLAAKRNAVHSTGSIVRAMAGLMSAGECDFAAIDKFRDDPLFARLVGASVPSEASFRQRLVRHAGQEFLRFGRGCRNFILMREIYATC